MKKNIINTSFYSKILQESVKTLIEIAQERNPRGYFGKYGGQYIPEVLHSPLQELSESFFELKNNAAFWEEYAHILLNYVGRPTPLYEAKQITQHIRSQLTEEEKKQNLGANIYVKLEGFTHTGAHKINNAIGQVLLAKQLGKTRIIAETGAGQHGLATATACAKLNIDCVVYMGQVDVQRQRPNVHAMELLGAKVVSVKSGQQTLKDAINEAMRDWAQNFSNTHYVIGSALGPTPFPEMVQCFHSIIGAELICQCKQQQIQPNVLVACVGGGSNAIGFFTPFLVDDMHKKIKYVSHKEYTNFSNVELHIAEAGGIGLEQGKHATRLAVNNEEKITIENKNKAGVRDSVVHGYKSKFLVNQDGQIGHTHSISAGLDYPGIGPIFANLADEQKITYSSVKDEQALQAVKDFAKHEGLIFALESAHAGAAALIKAKTLAQDKNIIINMSGRGDKDLFITAPAFNKDEWVEYLKSELERLT